MSWYLRSKDDAEIYKPREGPEYRGITLYLGFLVYMCVYVCVTCIYVCIYIVNIVDFGMNINIVQLSLL